MELKLRNWILVVKYRKPGMIWCRRPKPTQGSVSKEKAGGGGE